MKKEVTRGYYLCLFLRVFSTFFRVRKTKLPVFLLLATFIQMNAKNAYSQLLTFSVKEVSLPEVFAVIRQQTGYVFFYDAGLLKEVDQPVSITVKDAPLEEVLKVCLKNQPLDYLIENKTVVIVPKTAKSLRENQPAEQTIRLTGKVVAGENGEPLAGATIRIKGQNAGTVTNAEGEFKLEVKANDVLVVSFVGYQTNEIVVKDAKPLRIVLTQEIAQLEEINVVSTGYQALPKERATGSFEKISIEKINHTTGTNVLNRLEGITTNIFIPKNEPVWGPTGGSLQGMLIRGRSTLHSNAMPLVVVDGFPLEESESFETRNQIDKINPNDIESITILKDAAAASIWGARAGNGVIVITTKKGAYEQPLQTSFTSSITVSEKPDLFYLPRMKTSEYLEVEKFLFGKGYYDSKLNDTREYPAVTPFIELLAQQRKGEVSEAGVNAQMEEWGRTDVRRDYLKYMYRHAVNQQYALSVSGGSRYASFLVSGGYDKNLETLVTNDYGRMTLRSNMTVKPLKGLEVTTNIHYVEKSTSYSSDLQQVAYGSSGNNLWPYARLADDSGRPLAVNWRFRPVFLGIIAPLVQEGKLLDWSYKPLEELGRTEFKANSRDIFIILGLKYRISPVISAAVNYQYQRTSTESGNLFRADSYTMRDKINDFTDPATFNRAIPLGALYTPIINNLFANHLRGQLNADKTWNEKHHVVAIAGAEARENTNNTRQDFFYGYDEKRKSFVQIDATGKFPTYFGGSWNIPYHQSMGESLSRALSWFANASYTYDKRYITSFSVRRDASNIFGVENKKRGRPFWSAGLSWNVSDEPFYHLAGLTYLKLRLTYGYNGNAITVPGVASIVYSGGINEKTLLPYAIPSSPPNSELRWERTGMLNLGIDFRLKNDRLSGSMEFFDKRSDDLIASAPVDPSTGFQALSYNSANMHGYGADVTLNSNNLQTGDFTWTSNFLFGYTRSKVVHYLLKQPTARDYITYSGIVPVEGKDVYGMYAYRWAGLDPATGEPRGYLNGTISKSYSLIGSQSRVEDLKYFGSSIPVFMGSLRNTFSWRNIELSLNLQYKLCYYFRRSGVNYSNKYTHQEYSDRWQQPGDEKFTNVPAMVYPLNSERDYFYAYSEVLVEKAGHVRLQEINLSYSPDKPVGPVRQMRVYLYVNNLGILWAANKRGIDPDYNDAVPAPRTVAVGISASF